MPFFSKKYFRLLAVFIFALAIFSSQKNNPPAPTLGQWQKEVAETQESHYSVVRVVDGDTVDVDINGEAERIRLIGLDTPETVDPRRPVQCFGVEASNKAKSILTGQKVKIETDSSQGTRDKYRRLLAYIFLPDGALFNKMMIEEGYGHEYTYRLPYKYQAEFKAAERSARELKKGLWAAGVCEK